MAKKKGFYLNGLPIMTLELKHEAHQNVHDAVSQFTKRDHAHKIFLHPFSYLPRRRIKPEGVKIETPADQLPHVRHYADRKQEHFP